MIFTTGQIVEFGLDGWGGLYWQRVKLIGETPKRYRIEAIGRTKLAGRFQWLNPGETALLPKDAIREVRGQS